MDILLRFIYLITENIEYYSILALTFIAVVALILGVTLLVTKQNILAERLGRLLPGKTETPAVKHTLIEPQNLGTVAKFTKPLHDIVAPKQGATRKKTRLKLIRAGFRSEKALYNFFAAKVLLAVLLTFGYALFRFFFRFTPDIIVVCSALAISGYFFPDLVLWFITRDRQDKLTKAVPDALDLMVVCVESGLGLDMTLKRVGEEIRPISKDLSDEFFLTNMEVKAGRPRDESLKEMAVRTGVREIHSLMTMLVQTSRFGTSLAKALRIHADSMRIKRRQIAEEKAAKSAVKLVFPLVLFIFPALMIVLAGPAAIRIMQNVLPVFTR
jgi:tight adherence protein C